jgi:hypothetical protein
MPLPEDGHGQTADLRGSVSFCREMLVGSGRTGEEGQDADRPGVWRCSSAGREQCSVDCGAREGCRKGACTAKGGPKEVKESTACCADASRWEGSQLLIDSHFSVYRSLCGVVSALSTAHGVQITYCTVYSRGLSPGNASRTRETRGREKKKKKSCNGHQDALVAACHSCAKGRVVRNPETRSRQ